MWCGIKKTGLVGVCALLISAWASTEQDAQSVAKALTALGHKLVALGHFNDMAVPRNQAADELEAVAKEFEALETDFKRLWLAEDRENEGFQELVNVSGDWQNDILLTTARYVECGSLLPLSQRSDCT